MVDAPDFPSHRQCALRRRDGSLSMIEPRVTLLRRVPAMVEEVWQAWTDPIELMHWWAGIGGTVLMARCDPRRGGSFAITSRNVRGNMHEEWGVFTDAIVGEVLEFAWCHDQPGAGEHVTVQFRRTSDALCELTLVHFGLPDQAAAIGARARWDTALDSLVSSLNRPSLRS